MKLFVEAVKSYGAKTVLFGDSYDEACEHALALSDEKRCPFIHPYDDPDVIAGQGTIAVEVLRQCQQDIDAIFVPVGGGGLLAGILSYVKAIRPDIKIIGVEPEDAPCMHDALKAGRRVTLKQVGLFADGVAVKQAGKEPYRIAKYYLDDMVLVSTDEICAAIKDIFDDTRSIAEPAGAIATAGIKKYVSHHNWKNKCIVSMVCGANMNFDRLRHVAERAGLGEQREMLIAVTIPEKPGSFKRFCSDIGKRSITEFNYRYCDSHKAQIFAGIELQDRQEGDALLSSLEAKSYDVVDLSDNEMAKLHTRYMVGGHPNNHDLDEVIYRFEFPERPGALQMFLNALGGQWNISLFHYRNHGAAYGRVLVGFQVENATDAKALKKILLGLAYDFVEETENKAYDLFLK